MVLPTLRQSPIDPEFVQNPYPFYARARNFGPLVFWEDYGWACTTTFAATQAVLKDRRMGRAPIKQETVEDHLRPFYALEQHSLLQLEPPDHTRLRKLVLRAFTSRQVAALAPDIQALCLDLIDSFPEGAFDLLPAYATPIPVIVIARLLGVPEEVAPDLLRWSNAMVAMYQARRDRTIEEAAASAATEFTDFLRSYVEERRQKPEDDLITRLISAEEEGEALEVRS